MRRSTPQLCEALLAATFGVGSVGMAQIDPGTHRFLAANAALCQLCGYAEPELLSMTAEQLDAPGEPPCIEPAGRWPAGPGSGATERRMRRKDGSCIWVQVSMGVARDGQGRPARLVCLVQDVTQRRDALAALHAREERLAFLVRLNDRLRVCDAPEAMGREAARLLREFAAVDAAGYAEDRGHGNLVTAALGGMGGAPGSETRAAHLGALRAGRTVVQPDIANDPVLSATVKAAYAGRLVGAAVDVPLLRNGQLVAAWFVHSRRARAWTADEVSLFEDVAARVRADLERARAEAGVRAAKAKLEAALSSMGDAVCISDAAGRLVDINEAFALFHRFRDAGECRRLLGAFDSRFEMTRSAGLVVPPAQRPMARALRGEVASDVEFGVRDLHSGERWAGSYSFAPIRDADGRIVGSVCSARDVTESRRIRSELEASQAELRHLVATQGDLQERERLRLARKLHDDLQQNLAALLMEAEVVRTTLAGLDGPAGEALDRIDRLGREVIGSMRRIVLDLRPQALEELGLVAALQSLARGFTARRGIACSVDSTGIGAMRQARLVPLATCLYRFVEEALVHASGAHPVRIRLAPQRPGRIAVEVSDGGAGIPPDAAPRAGRFGLPGLREQVRALGGTLELRPGPDGGTVFVATLPLAPGRPARAG